MIMINIATEKNQHMKWLVIFDSTICRIYNYDKNQIILIKEVQHPENKLKDIDITTDKPGRYQSKDYAHGAYSQKSDPKEIKIENFSREIANILEHGRSTHSYEKLILVASPHMNGLLLKHLNKQVHDLIALNIQKDLIHIAENKLLVCLNGLIENNL